MRLIDAEALAKFIDFGHLRNPNEKAYSENDIREMIDMFVTINSPVRHGHWVESFKVNAPPSLRTRWTCSWCGNVQTYGVTDYCPNCGAIMDGDENEID